MSYTMDSTTYTGPVARASQSVRVEFIRKTYNHLAMAVLAFIGLEYVFLNSALAPALTSLMTGGYSWLIVLAAFMGISWIADNWARSATSLHMQYAGLILYVIAEAVIFVPLLYIANQIAPGVITNAAVITGLLFVGLTYVAFTTRKDFTFLGGALKIGSFVALGFIAASILFASGAILYETSAIIHHYSPQQHVAASLSLFASVALLFWYVVRFLMSFTNSD
jgi:FtsH-binding integral membrane protein